MTRLKMIAAVLVTSGALPIASQAAPISHSGIASAVQSQSVVEQVAFRWAGREYCFYDDGWRGPGWYWCGYRLRSGLGWGGPTGWHGWATEGVIRERGRIGVEERGRIGVERRGVVEERGRIGVERRGVVEERGRVGVEQRGRVGVQERGGREPTTTGRGGFPLSLDRCLPGRNEGAGAGRHFAKNATVRKNQRLD
jgi:hypothetical protein